LGSVVALVTKLEYERGLMTDYAARWLRVEQLCAAALQRAGAERAAFLRDFPGLSVIAVAAAVMSLTSRHDGTAANALVVGPVMGAGGMATWRALTTASEHLPLIVADFVGDDDHAHHRHP
jgi:hypothetical protein